MFNTSSTAVKETNNIKRTGLGPSLALRMRMEQLQTLFLRKKKIERCSSLSEEGVRTMRDKTWTEDAQAEAPLLGAREQQLKSSRSHRANGR